MTEHNKNNSNETPSEPPSQPLLKMPRIRPSAPGPRSRRKRAVPTFKPEPVVHVDENAVPTDSDAFNTAEREAVVEPDWVVPVTSSGRFDGPTMSPGGPPAQFLTATYGRISAVYVAVQRRGWKALLPILLIVTVLSIILFVPGTSDAIGDLVRRIQSGKDVGQSAPPSPDTENQSPLGAIQPVEEDAELPSFRTGRLVFASNRGDGFDLYLFDLVTGYEEQLTDHPASDRSPAWSPDGRRIAFVSDRDGRDALWLFDLETRQVNRLTNGAALDRNPAWSADGARIAFSRETIDGSSIMILNAACLDLTDSCEETIEAVTTGRYDLSPTWSPDRMQLALTTSALPGEPSRIGILPLGAVGISLLDGTRTIDITPAWSPDGELLAFAAHTEGAHDLYWMRPDGAGLDQATFSEANDVDPAWSPDGAFVVFASDRSANGEFDLYILPNGCNDRDCADDLIHLTTLAGDELDPAWGP